MVLHGLLLKKISPTQSHVVHRWDGKKLHVRPESVGSNLRDLYGPPRVHNNFFLFSGWASLVPGPEASTKRLAVQYRPGGTGQPDQ